MKKVRIERIGLILIFLGVLSINHLSQAREPELELVGKYGSIDWINQKIVATGIGVASGEAFQNPAQARIMTSRAAEVVARRNLLEVVMGIRIDSRTSVVDYAAKDDKIVVRVKGVLENSVVEGYRYLADGSVEATVSMPLRGRLSGILLKISNRPDTIPAATSKSETLESRIVMLEQRIRILEEKLSGFKRLHFEQEQLIFLFKQFLTAEEGYISLKPRLMRAGYVSDSEVEVLRNEIARQGGKLAELAKTLGEMSGRLKTLEISGERRGLVKKTEESRGFPSYTGLVIDARNIKFKPCLKPEIVFQGKLVYPGGYVNLDRAIRSGYIRYYRKIESAQQSVQVGNMPLTIAAGESGLGQGSLEIDADAYQILNTVKKEVDNFMAQCKVVIVF